MTMLQEGLGQGIVGTDVHQAGHRTRLKSTVCIKQQVDGFKVTHGIEGLASDMFCNYKTDNMQKNEVTVALQTRHKKVCVFSMDDK